MHIYEYITSLLHVAKIILVEISLKNDTSFLGLINIMAYLWPIINFSIIII